MIILETRGRGQLLGSALGLEKKLHTENKTEKTKIKDIHNGTKIGTINIYMGNQFRFQISAQ